jgi:hypothetical protein
MCALCTCVCVRMRACVSQHTHTHTHTHKMTTTLIMRRDRTSERGSERTRHVTNNPIKPWKRRGSRERPRPCLPRTKRKAPCLAPSPRTSRAPHSPTTERERTAGKNMCERACIGRRFCIVVLVCLFVRVLVLVALSFVFSLGLWRWCFGDWQQHAQRQQQ